MSTIKNLLYLDEYKMYSISSQLFGGLTASLTNRDQHSEDREDRQSGPFGSGRVMADILGSRSTTEERKFLHDYSFTLFEEALQERDKILHIPVTNVEEIVAGITEASFVATRARTVFNDMHAIDYIMSNFNAIGEALTYVSAFSSGLLSMEDTAGLSKRQAQIQEADRKKKLRDTAQATGLSIDPDYLKHLRVILEYGYGDNFEIQQEIGGYKFSAILQREYFREPADLIVKKYSRFSQQDLILLGTVAQSPQRDTQGPIANADDRLEATQTAASASDRELGMKEALMVMLEQLHAMETVMAGNQSNEVIIDPIALYREL